MAELQLPITAPLSEQAASKLMWVYVLGSRDGRTVKIGHTKTRRIADRMRQVAREQMSDETYVLLAGMRTFKAGEEIAHAYFREWRQNRGSHKEYYDASDPLVEWVLWLRQQWFVTFDSMATESDAYEAHPDEWVPTPQRRERRPMWDANKLIQDTVQLSGPLAGTAWDWMPDLTYSFQDYFTPPPIVKAAETAMGGIDLDAASHWIANRRLHAEGVHVREYFHTNKSAFTHEWAPRVWLNPPYGDNDRWFSRALWAMDTGQTEQLCMLSPIYVFTTKIAQPIMQRSQAAVILSPTPEFYNPGAPEKTGTNLPHAVVYWGDHPDRFLAAFAEFGIPITLSWDVRGQVAV